MQVGEDIRIILGICIHQDVLDVMMENILPKRGTLSQKIVIHVIQLLHSNLKMEAMRFHLVESNINIRLRLVRNGMK